MKALGYFMAGVITVGMALTLTGCVRDSAAVAETLDAPQDGVVLRLPPIRMSGKLAAKAPKQLSVDDLERLPQSEYAVMDPYAKKRITYRGVLVRDLATAYAAPDATSLDLRAIDDFHSVITQEEWNRYDVLLATRRDGRRMSIANNGPARIVYPYDTAKDLDPLLYNDKWIWQLNRAVFK